MRAHFLKNLVLLLLLLPRVISAEVSGPKLPTLITVQTGKVMGHTELWKGAGPSVLGGNIGGTSPVMRTAANPEEMFTAEHQKAFADDLTQALTARALTQPATDGTAPAATLAVHFLKTEYFPEERDYLLQVLVTAGVSGKNHERIYQVTTSGPDGKTGAFPTVAGGRRRAAEKLRDALVADVATWFTSPDARPEGMRIPMRFDPGSDEIVGYLRERFGPKPTSGQALDIRVTRPTETSAVVECRWRGLPERPPFCVVAIYAEGSGTRVTIAEYNRKAVAKSGIVKDLHKFLQDELNGTP